MNFGRSILAGLIATAVMTLLIVIAPLIGMPEMNIGEMLGAFFGVGATIGWVLHFVVGATLAMIYAAWFATRLPGNATVRGLIYGVLVFFVAQLVATPILGGEVFSGGDLAMITGSLLGHLVYGGVLGAFYGQPRLYVGETPVDPRVETAEPVHR